MWREAVETLHAKLAKLGEVLTQNGRESSPAVELLMLLASGVPPSYVQTYLLRELSGEALQRILKALSVASAALTQVRAPRAPRDAARSSRAGCRALVQATDASTAARRQYHCPPPTPLRAASARRRE